MALTMAMQLGKTRASKDFLELVRAIGECKSKSEEDAIMVREVETLKAKLRESGIERSNMKELLLRLLYVEMLGHDASFGYIHAVKMCNEQQLILKKVGYLTTALVLDEHHELIILIINTLQQDLRSDNYLVVCAALVACSRLVSAETIPALLNSVLELLPHPKESVRKKALLCLHCFYQRAPDAVAPHLQRFRQMLCDKDPAVMSAALCVLQHLIAVDPAPYKNLVPSFVNILKQVVEQRLPKTYNYHRVPAPFIQVRLLKLLGHLGHNDRTASEHMYTILGEVLRRGDSHHTIGNALLYEAVRTITKIVPNARLLESCAMITARFLRSSGHNLKYIGIDALGLIVKINAQYATEHQMAVIDCLEDPDETLKRKTLTLLYKMTNPGNVEVIVERMVDFLRGCTDAHVKRDTVSRVIELAERYAPSNQWFVATVNQVLLLAGDLVPDSVAHNLMRLVAEGAGDDDDAADHELRTSAVEAYLQLLSTPQLPPVLMKIVYWVLGEYGLLAPQQSAQSLVATLVAATERHANDGAAAAHLKGFALTAITKVCAHARLSALPEAAEPLARAAETSQCVDLQQRAHELRSLLSLPPPTLAAVVPADASCESLQVDPTLGFLDGFVAEALAGGAEPFVPPESRAPAVGTATPTSSTGVACSSNGGGGGHELRFDAYAHPAEMAAAAATGYSAGGFSDPGAAVAGRPAPTAPTSQLRLNTGDGPKKWAPQPPPPQSRSPAPAAPAAAAAAAIAAPVARTPPPEADVAPRELSEKEKLAASLFGGLSGGGRSVARPSSTSAAAKSSFNVPPPVTTTTTTTSSPMDLLMDLSSPPAPSPAAAVDPFAALEGLSLGEPSQPSAPPAAAAIDLTSLYGGPPPAAMMGMGVGMGAPGMMQQMQPGMMMGMQQQQPAPMGAASVLPSGMGSAPMNPAAAPAKAAEKDPFGDLLG